MYTNGLLLHFPYSSINILYPSSNESTKHNFDIYLEQYGAPAYRCESNRHLLNKLFPDGRWIQNHPNSPDFAYPIENLWGIIKPRVKRRNPQTLDELKQFFLKNGILFL